VAVPSVAGLRYRNWRERSTHDRIAALQEMEDALAKQEERDACTVRLMSECPYVSADDRPNTRGLQRGQEIWINDRFVSDQSATAESPAMATETLFHESEHAYQDHVAANPELAEDPQQLQDFTMNRGPGYFTQEQDGDALYLSQPVEKDARDVARERTEEFYGGETADSSGYLGHRQRTEAEEGLNHRTCVDHLGDNYEQIARQKAFERYQRHETYQQARAEADETLTQQEGQPGQPAAPADAEELGEEAGRATEEAAEEASERAGLSAEPPADAVQKTAEEASETAAQSDEAQVDPAQEAAHKAPTAPSEQEEDRDYDYGYGYGY